MTPAVSWTDDRVEWLKKFWEQGLSASQIAAELGNVTRNAVIGKAHRLGLTGRKKLASPGAPRRTPSTATIRIRRPTVARGNQALKLVADECEVEQELLDNIVPLHQRVSLMQLNDANCHFPIGDPRTADFAFCGGRAWGGSSYCAHHMRAAYQPAGARRERTKSHGTGGRFKISHWD